MTNTSEPAEEHVEVHLDGQLEGLDLVENARRRHGALGAVVAAGMVGIDQAVFGRKPREEAPVVISSNSDPVDIDTDGMEGSLDDGMSFGAPPLPRTPVVVPPPARRRRWR
jgi:hypothetical protein